MYRIDLNTVFHVYCERISRQSLLLPNVMFEMIFGRPGVQWVTFVLHGFEMLRYWIASIGV